MSIQLQFSRQADLVSDLIAWFTQGSFSHVDSVLDDHLLGARSDCNSGVQIRPRDYARFAKTTIFSIPCSDEQRHLFWEFLFQQLGKPYDTWAILGFITGRDWREDDSWICSELQAAALEYSGIVPKLYLPVNKISPDSLAFALSALKGVTVHENT